MSTYAMVRHIICGAALLCLPFVCAAQSNPLDKKLEKAKDMAANGKLDDADKYLVKVLDDEPSFGEGWDLLTDIRYKQYENSKLTSGLFSGKNLSFTIKTTDKDGNEVKDGSDTLARQLTEMLNSIDPSKKAYSKFIYTARRATMASRSAYGASAYLRIFSIDMEVDTNVGKKALKYFKEAETEFADKNYSKAAMLYRHAIEHQPDFYKARMYLGDCYYFMNIYNDAIAAFKESRDRFPFLLEPRKYLVDSYWKIFAYDKAVDEAINATIVYPDFTMMQRMEDAAYMDHRRINIQWTPRGVLPNKANEKNTLNDYTDKDEESAAGPWVAYQAAGDTIASYCDSNGIIVKANPLTTARYMEVFSWEEMLRKNPTDKSLDEARKMQKQGYLDCYVMVSCYHYDFYKQFAHFSTNNKERIADYFKAFTIAR